MEYRCTYIILPYILKDPFRWQIQAWRAMAGLEEQLSRETDMSEEPSVRQALAH